MPNWLLPLACLIILGSFIYVGFWKGLSNKRDENNRDTMSQADSFLSSHSSTDSHHN